MTDGHLLFKSNIYNQGQRPAIDISYSVSRVGRQTQPHIQNQLADLIKNILARATELETVSRFSAELPQETQVILRRRAQILEFLKQEGTFVAREVQTCLLGLVFTDFLKDKEFAFVADHKQTIIDAFSKNAALKEFASKVFSFKDLNSFLKELGGLAEKLTMIIEKKVEEPTPKMTNGQ